eukprot:5695770-Pyramimonas_sp.AAC.1
MAMEAALDIGRRCHQASGEKSAPDRGDPLRGTIANAGARNYELSYCSSPGGAGNEPRSLGEGREAPSPDA